MQKREQEKEKWKRLRKFFGKIRMESISAVEYTINRLIMRISSQLQIEEVVIIENASRFFLASSSSIFSSDIIERIRMYSEKGVNNLVYNNIELITSNKEINYFLNLMCQLNPFSINTKISLDR